MISKSIKNKKLLVLGGIALSSEIIKYAHRMGLTVYVTDYFENSPAKKYAEKSFMVSTTDTEALSDLIRHEKIDGVLTGFIDLLLPYYEEVCKKTDLPCYATNAQIKALTDKILFKELCRKFEIPVVEEYKIQDPLENQKFKNLKYPLLIKPTDNSGGRGITICYDSSDFVSNYKKSLSFSKSRNVLIERLMNTPEVTIFYMLQNGKVMLTAMGDRHIQHFQDGLIPLPVAYTFPSVHLSEYQEMIHPKVIEMFNYLEMKNGIVFIQSFVENGKCIFYEIGYRLTGSLEYKIIEHASGFNPLEMMIEHSVGEKSDLDIEKLANPNFKQEYCNITFLSKPGKIGKISGVDEILKLPNVLDVVLSYNVGDEIPPNALGTLGQVVARVFAFAATKNELKSVMDEIHCKFNIMSENGNNMMIQAFDTNNLLS